LKGCFENMKVQVGKKKKKKRETMIKKKGVVDAKIKVRTQHALSWKGKVVKTIQTPL